MATLSIFTILTIRTMHLSCSHNRNNEHCNNKNPTTTVPKNMACSISNGSLEKGRRKMAIDQPTNKRKKKKNAKTKKNENEN